MGAANMPFVVLMLLSLTFCALAKTSIPSSIEVPEIYKLRQSLHAKGYQYYRFNATACTWVAFNATARLYHSESKRQVGHHFYLPEADARGGQPTWTSRGSHHRSRVTGKAVAKAVVDRDSITWVLLESTQAHGDKAFFGDVAFVQRVNTEMGLAPATTSGAGEGDVKKVPYTADYLFYVAHARSHHYTVP